MRFLVVSVGRNPGERLRLCLESIKAQTVPNMEVCAVDDASEDGSDVILKEFGDLPGWTVILNSERKWAMANQVAAWKALEPQDDDVIVFCDLDDAFAHPGALAKLKPYYARGAWMTYGSYQPVPEHHPSARTCQPARPYPERCIYHNAYRRWPPFYNHLRTVSWRVLKHLEDSDFQDDAGQYWKAIMDPAVMIPCLEMAGPQAFFVPEVLYNYTCDGSDAVWRTMKDVLAHEWAQLRARPVKERL